MSFVFDVAVIWLGTLLLYRYRALVIQRLPVAVPSVLWFVFLLIFLITIEESINCIDYNDGLGCRMSPLINLILFTYISLAALVTYVTRRYFSILITTIGIGVLWEISIGGLSGLALSPFYGFMVVHVLLSYAFIAIIPLYLVHKYHN